MRLDQRVKELEKNLAELTDLVRHLTWGYHNDDVHNRAFALLGKVKGQVGAVDTLEVAKTSVGRKFR